ncbi:calcium-activated chloride channel regulator 2 [Caerostris extrusa]|uniref:Calcium-activated chloride channel regulator 2 n=1 Tax=Caerostris extrusa TaxID=172846 RepID=A0AAV4RQ50_CAEEX|nr:calcium-activated chloride channel regulator 2 [Caerostris extrusa]
MLWRLYFGLIVWTYFGARASILIDSDGGYKNIVVAIEPKIPESKISAYLSELEIIFQNASKVLHTATREGPNYFSDPNILVTSEDAFSSPYALQNDGCGRQGAQNSRTRGVPVQQDIGKSEKVFIKEWAKYRYGIFDESGFDGDELYPTCYTIPGSNITKVTDCSNKEIIYNLKKTSKSEFCNPVPINGKNTQVTSSLMSRTDLPQVNHFCDDDSHPHNRNIPTKHNSLCKLQSTWKIISQHPDFKFKPIKKMKKVENSVTFKYVMESEMRLIVAVDTSNNMVQNDRLDMVRNAFSYFALYDLPEFSVVGLKNLKNKDDSPSLVTVKTPADAERLIDSFPEAYGEEETLKTSSNISQGQIVLISATDVDESQLKNLEDILQKNEATLHVLYFRKFLRSAPHLQKLATVSRGSFFYIPEEFKNGSTVSTLTLIYEAFRSMYESFSWMNKNHVFVDQQTFLKDTCTTCSISFQSDPSMETFHVLLTGPQFLVGPPVIRDKTILSNGNQNFSAGHSSFSYKIKIPAYVFTIKNPKSNTWSLTFERRSGYDKPLVVIIRSIGPKNDGIINMKSWINIQENPMGLVLKHPPITFYSEVKKGHLPIVKGSVSALLYHPESGEEIKLDMIDNGDGDPDITGNDGIFSRYFSEISRSGYYILTTIAETYSSPAHIENYVSVSKYPRCCGSSYPSDLSYNAQPFKRIVTYGSFYVPLENIRLQFPPRRINDLRVEKLLKLYDRGTYVLKWTAPGSNCDFGIAIDYQLRLFNNREDASSNFDSYILIIDSFHIHGPILEPFITGTSQSTIIDPKNVSTGIYYLSMRTVNSNGQFSDISNVVEISYTAPTVPFIKSTIISIIETTTNSEFKKGKLAMNSDFKLAIGISMGLLFLFLIVGIFLYVYWARARKHRKEKEEKRQHIISHYGGGPSLDNVHKTESRDALYQSNNTLNISVISPINSWPANSLLSHYETLQRNKYSDVSESSTIQAKDTSDTASIGSSKYSYVQKVDQNSIYDPVYFSSQNIRDDINRPYNPSFTPFNPPYTSSLRHTPNGSPVEHNYSLSNNNYNTCRSDRSRAYQLATDM